MNCAKGDIVLWTNGERWRVQHVWNTNTPEGFRADLESVDVVGVRCSVNCDELEPYMDGRD